MTSPKFVFAAAVALVVATAAPLSRLAQAADTTSKIAPRVLSETENGGSTEALVVLAEQADLSPAASLNTKLAKGRFVVDILRATANRTQAPIINLLKSRGVNYQPFYIVNMIKVTGTRNLMEELAARADVAQIDANPHVRTALPWSFQDSTFQPAGIEWNITRVKAPDVWALGYHGEGLVVAGADTGVQWDHPALKNHYRGWNGNLANHDYNWHDATSQHLPVPTDPHGHGTFTASEMVGDDGQGNQIGVAPAPSGSPAATWTRAVTGHPRSTPSASSS